MSEAQHSFNIRTSEEFFRKLKEEYDEFKANPLSARHAINAAMTAWHLQEWLWADKLKGNYMEQQRVFGKALRSREELAPTVIALCEELSIMQEICNGSKHFRTEKDTVIDTGVRMDTSSSGILGAATLGRMTLASSGVPYLAVISKTGVPNRFQSVLDKVFTFWSSVFDKY